MPIKDDEIIYTTEERSKIIDFWNKNRSNPPSLETLVAHFTDGAESDPRTVIGHKVRKILLDCKIKAKTKEWEKVEPYVLSDSDKEFIKNHIGTNRVIEIARLLNPDKKIQPLGREIRAINHYLNSIKEEVIRIPGDETLAEERYVPPKTVHQILAKVNLYLHAGLTLQSMTAFDKKCLETTINFLHSPRFVQEINNYTGVEKRTAFEADFIRSVFSKIDLTPEEVSLTINWCSDILQASDLKRQLDRLNEILDSTTEDREGKAAMALVEAIGKVTGNLNEVLKRQERIYSLLNKSRSKRDEEKQNKTASLAALFQWATEEDNRKKMLEKAELQKKLRESEVKRIQNLDDLIMCSMGISVESAIS